MDKTTYGTVNGEVPSKGNSPSGTSCLEGERGAKEIWGPMGKKEIPLLKLLYASVDCQSSPAAILHLSNSRYLSSQEKKKKKNDACDVNALFTYAPKDVFAFLTSNQKINCFRLRSTLYPFM
ncbi:hypothetical protein POVCU2_0049680 [Plasmodium ovale curtisi]|uniref:Uncharacterized protein n=1 Tax=Plasmodium ovale curtisi TaxID=864141 RepID=A0A1A8WBR3_PLAOA|nr:hypothetical protein POVCU2_0049680 [Plasmodium ovale curtisi]